MVDGHVMVQTGCGQCQPKLLLMFSGRELRVNQKPHSSHVHVHYRVVKLPGGVFQCGRDVGLFQVRVVGKDFLMACPGGQQVENVSYSNP